MQLTMHGAMIAIRLDRDFRSRTIRRMREPIRLLLSFTILACPLNCMGAFNGGDTQSAEQSKCGCCPHDSMGHQPKPDHPPDSPDDTCPCPTCLCNGAVLCADDAAIEVEFSGLNSAGVALLENHADASSPVLLALRRPHLGWPITASSTGRFVRVLRQSFQF